MSAAIPSAAISKTGATEVKGTMSHGRGGAGNMGTTPSDFDRPTLDTPTIKGEVYTTGRGGSGNMAKNDDPEAARRAQDVVAPPRRESNNSTHVGRGGAANVFSPSQLAELKKNGVNHDNAIDTVSQDGEKVQETAKLRKGEKGWADRSKDWLFKRVRELKHGKNVGRSVAGKEVSGGGLIWDESEHIEESGSGSSGKVEEGVVNEDAQKETVASRGTSGGDAGEDVAGAEESVTIRSSYNTVLDVDDGFYLGIRHLPHSSTLGSLNENRVSGGIFDNDPVFNTSRTTGQAVALLHTFTLQAPDARKGIYANKFKSSWNLRERFSHANLRSKAKEDENEDKEVEEGTKKKNKLGMQKAFGKSTFF